MDRPMLFRPEMVRALLDGRKTQTRRPAWRDHSMDRGDDIRTPTAAQRIKPGDRLWVRERWSISGNGPYYTTDVDDTVRHAWRPSIHMPRKFSRLTLIVTAVKIERLQDISEEDAKAEGAKCLDIASGREDVLAVRGSWRAHFRAIYEGIHGPEAWKANPEVVAITFTVHKANIDQLAKAKAA